MKRKMMKKSRSVLAGLISAAMLMSSVQVPVFAADAAAPDVVQEAVSDSEEGAASDAVDASAAESTSQTGDGEETAKTEERAASDGVSAGEIGTPAPEETGAEEFEQSMTIDGVTVTVSADAGVFPNGAALSVKEIDNQQKVDQYEQAADAADGLDGTKTPDKKDLYAFDISVLDREGGRSFSLIPQKAMPSFPLM